MMRKIEAIEFQRPLGHMISQRKMRRPVSCVLDNGLQVTRRLKLVTAAGKWRRHNDLCSYISIKTKTDLIDFQVAHFTKLVPKLMSQA